MENIISSLASIFQHYTLHSNLTGFSSDKWNMIDSAAQRVFSISNLLSNDDQVDTMDFPNALLQLTNGKFDIDFLRNFYEKKDFWEYIYKLEYKEFDYKSFYGRRIEDVIEVNLKHVYPLLIAYLKKQGMIHSLKKHEHFLFILNNYDNISSLLSKNEYSLQNYINYAFGLLDKKDREIIRLTSEIIIDSISKTKGFFFTIDNMFLFKNHKSLKSEIKYKLDLLKIPYSIKDVDLTILQSKSVRIIIYNDCQERPAVHGFMQLEKKHEILLGFYENKF
jgi:hypothetical protein